MKNWKMISRPEPGPDDEDLLDLLRSDYLIDAHDRAILGKPRSLLLKGFSQPFVRLTPTVDPAEQDARRGASDRRDGMAVRRLISRVSEVKTLTGPSTTHEVDELAAALFAEAREGAISRFFSMKPRTKVTPAGDEQTLGQLQIS